MYTAHGVGNLQQGCARTAAYEHVASLMVGHHGRNPEGTGGMRWIPCTAQEWS